MLKKIVSLAFLGLFLMTAGFAQSPLDGRGKPVNDPLLDKLVGEWKITRKFPNRTAENKASVKWVLDHQFLLIHMTDVKVPSSYEAMIFVGYDNTSERYVAHWIDVFGGRFSETLGYGTRSGNRINFIFEYPDGPFHNSFIFDPVKGTWIFSTEQKDASGKWKPFADDFFEPAK